MASPFPVTRNAPRSFITNIRNGDSVPAGTLMSTAENDLVLSILNIYRKYYGWRMAGFLFVTFYAAMAGAGLIVDLIFGAVGLLPEDGGER